MLNVNRRNLIQAAVIAGGALALPLGMGPKLAHAQESSWAAQKKKVRVRGLEMAYYEVGTGDQSQYGCELQHQCG